MVSDRNIRDVGIADIDLKTVNSCSVKPVYSCFSTRIYYSFSGTT